MVKRVLVLIDTLVADRKEIAMEWHIAVVKVDQHHHLLAGSPVTPFESLGSQETGSGIVVAPTVSR